MSSDAYLYTGHLSASHKARATRRPKPRGSCPMRMEAPKSQQLHDPRPTPRHRHRSGGSSHTRNPNVASAAPLQPSQRHPPPSIHHSWLAIHRSYWIGAWKGYRNNTEQTEQTNSENMGSTWIPRPSLSRIDRGDKTVAIGIFIFSVWLSFN